MTAISMRVISKVVATVAAVAAATPISTLWIAPPLLCFMVWRNSFTWRLVPVMAFDMLWQPVAN
jgi:hypothetical protein